MMMGVSGMMRADMETVAPEELDASLHTVQWVQGRSVEPPS